MHSGALRKWSLALTFWLALQISALRAQIFTAPLQASTTGTNPVDFEFRADGTLISKGYFGTGASLLSSDQGSGTRLLWYPKLGAFRAGSVTGTEWDQANLGANSTALGIDTKASGHGSTAVGYNTTASGLASVAMGYYTSASGHYSVAFGGWTTASGYYSAALGGGTVASGQFSTSIGGFTTASGSYSTASGYETTASAYASFAVGVFNVGGGNSTAWVSTDPLFEVGNGGGNGFGNPSATGRADAFVIYKNGNATFNGSNNLMPAQTLTGPNSMLTEGLADQRYLARSASATGTDSVALGHLTSATGTYSTAFGNGSTASAYLSTALGHGSVASGIVALAAGQLSTASGGFSVSLGCYSTASGDSSLALGYGANATGSSSTSLGVYSVASGENSTTLGFETLASGANSTAIGYYTKASSYASVAIGQRNIGAFAPGGDATWISTDPLFEIGNGTPTAPSDAFIVYKNGNAAAQGTLTAPVFITTAPNGSGDIPMYSGN